MMLRNFLACCLLLAAPHTGAADAAAKEPPAINAEMAGIGALMSHLLNERVLAEPKVAGERLAQLDARFRGLEAHAADRGPAFRITFATTIEQIGRTREAIELGTATPESLRNLVHGIATTCAGCHTQDDKGQVLSYGRLAPATEDPLQQARFRYITRDYAGALQLFDSFLSSRPRLAYDAGVLEALEGELTILAQVYRDPQRGVTHFRQRLDRSGGSMSRQVKKDLQAWVRGFEDVRKARLKGTDVGWADINAYARQYLMPHEGTRLAVPEKDKVVYLWLRGLMHEYMQANPADANMPQLLYWLALLDRALDYNLYYSLSDLYLKECMVRWPQTDTALQCFAEYERYVMFAYSGSGGEYIPAEVVDELARLRKLLDDARKR